MPLLGMLRKHEVAMLFNLDKVLGKEDIDIVLKELSVNCTACRLSFLHPHNRGLLCRGNPKARIGVLAEAPGDKETEMGQPLVGNSGKEWDRWAKAIGVDTNKECFATNVIQCQPYKVPKDGKQQQEAPDKDEIRACWVPRGLRVLKAMPNLEVVVTLGWVAAKALLGGEPKGKSHEGNWFESSALPGIAVFCMPHPSFILREPSPDKDARVALSMQAFKREYLDTKKCYNLAQEVKARRDACQSED
jgi:uracil-DNA glycosylase